MAELPVPADDKMVEEQEPFAGEEYWAATADTDALISAIGDRATVYFDFLERRGFREMWQRVFAQAHGLDKESSYTWETQQITFRGEQDESLNVCMNEYRSFERQTLTMIVGHRPSFDVVASNTDYDSISQVDIGQGICEYYWRHQRVERRHQRTCRYSIRYGLGWTWLFWDPSGGDDVETEEGQVKTGKLTIRSKPPWDVVIDPYRDEDDDHDWVVVRNYQNRWDLAAQYASEAEEILRSDNQVSTEEKIWHITRDVMDQSEDEVVVQYFYHARTPAMPDGRLFIHCGKAVLYDGPLPDDDIPLVDMRFSPYEGTALGYSDAWDWLAPQELLDSVVSAVASNVDAFGEQIIAVPDGSDIDLEALANGQRVLYIPPGMQELPRPVQLAEMPEAAKWLIEYLHQRMEAISGLNSVARGDPAANIKSGTMAALFHAIAVEFQSFAQAQADQHIERLMTLVLRMLKRHAQYPQLALIAGVDDKPQMMRFKSEDLAPYDRVVVTSANPLLRTTAGKMEIAQAMMQVPGAVRTPEQIVEVYTTGQLKPAFKASRAQLEYIQWENEVLAKGTQVAPGKPDPMTGMPGAPQTPEVPVLATDDPKLHITEHLALTCTPYVRQNPEILQGILAHIEWHKEVARTLDPLTAALSGFQMPQMPMMGPAPGPQGAPEEPPDAMQPDTMGTGEFGPEGGPGQPGLPSPAQSPTNGAV